MKTEPEDIAHWKYYKQFDKLHVTMDDFLDYINYLPKRLKAGISRNGFELTKLMDNSFKTFVLERKGYIKEKFIKDYYNNQFKNIH